MREGREAAMGSSWYASHPVPPAEPVAQTATIAGSACASWAGATGFARGIGAAPTGYGQLAPVLLAWTGGVTPAATMLIGLGLCSLAVVGG